MSLAIAFALACAPASGPNSGDETARAYLEQFEPLSNRLFVDGRFPDGSAPAGTDEIVVHFSQPMASPSNLGEQISFPPLVLRPAVAWKAWWENPRTLVARPETAFVPDTPFSARVPAGTLSLSGAVLLDSAAFSFILARQGGAPSPAAMGLATYRLDALSAGELPFDIAKEPESPEERNRTLRHGPVSLNLPRVVRIGDVFEAAATIKNAGDRPVSLRYIWQAKGLGQRPVAGDNPATVPAGGTITLRAVFEVSRDELKAAGIVFHRDNAFTAMSDVRFSAEGVGLTVMASLPVRILKEPEQTVIVAGSVETARRHVFERTPGMSPDDGGLTLQLASPGAEGGSAEGDGKVLREARGRVSLNGHEIMAVHLDSIKPMDEIFLPMARLPARMEVDVARDSGTLFYEFAFTSLPRGRPDELVEKGMSLVRSVRDATGNPPDQDTLWRGGVYEVRFSLYAERPFSRVEVEDPLPAGIEPISYAAVAGEDAGFIRYAAVNLHPVASGVERKAGSLSAILKGIRPGLLRFSYYARAEHAGVYPWPPARATDREALVQTATSAFTVIQVR